MPMPMPMPMSMEQEAYSPIFRLRDNSCSTKSIEDGVLGNDKTITREY